MQIRFTAKDIASFLDGTVEGDASVVLTSISKIDPGEPGTLTFLSNPKYTRHLYTTKASAALVNKDFVAEQKVNITLIRVEDAYRALASLLELHEQSKPRKTGIHPRAFVAESVQTGKDVYIGPNSSIGEGVQIGDGVIIYPNVTVGDQVRIGNNTVLHPGVTIYEGCIIGNDCCLHAGVVIGSDGFGFAPGSANNYQKIPQVGNVILEDNVEIGANTSIDRATMGSTIIRKGVKLDNLIQIAHNVEVGENTVICAQSGISGSTRIGKNCIIAGQVGIIGHLEIGDNVRIAAQSGVTKNLKENSTVQGSAAFDFGQYQKAYVVFKNLPELREKVLNIQNELNTLKTKNN